MKSLNAKWKILLAAGAVLVQGLLFSASAQAAAPEDTVGESPFKMQWEEGDPTSTDPAKYQIYPIPQKITYQEGAALTLSGEIKIAAGDSIDASTRTYITEVLEAEGLTVAFVDKSEEDAQIRMGVKDDGSLAAGLTPSDTGLFEKNDAYILTVADNKVTILGKDTTAAFYGVATLKMMLSSLENSALVPVVIEDYADVAVRGIVEGFYGGFQDDHRKSEMLFSQDVKMNVFIYASKTDAYHDRLWADPYSQEKMDYFKELVDLQEKTKCEFSWAVHTGYFFRSLTADNREAQMDQLKAKFQQFIDIGVRRFALLNDDYGAGDVATVVSVVNEINKWLTDQGFPSVAYCPQGYNVSWAGNGNEIRGLADLDDDILIFWTGRDVNSPFWKDSLEYVINNTKKSDGSYQQPMFWVNYPCNEHTGGRGLLLGSAKYYLKGDIKGLMGGAVSNPVEFAETNKIAFFQLANYFWNIEKGAENVDHTWEQAFKYLQPEVYDAYYTIARNACEAPGSSRIPGQIDESAYMAAELDAVKTAVTGDTLTAEDQNAQKLLAEFVHIQEAMDEFLENCENDSLIAELSNPGHLKGVVSGEGWIQALDNLGRAGELLIRAEMEMAGAAPDKDKIWTWFSEAVTEMERYNTRTHAYHGATDVQTRAGTKRILPFVNALMTDVEGYINAQSSMTVFETPADRIYTNVSSLARNPLTIQQDEFSVRSINALSLPAGGYVGIKKAGIASITEFVLEGRGLDGLKLEYSLHGDSWTEAQAGTLETPVLARYVRLRNAGTAAATVTVKKLGIRVNNEEPKTKITSNFPVDTSMGARSLDGAIDGNRTTFVLLNKNQAANDHVTVDLGEERPIHDIAFYTEDGSRYIYRADVEIAGNDQAFRKIGEINDESNSKNIDPPFRKYEFNVNGQQGRYVRLKITKAEGQKIKLHEIEINQKAPAYDSGRTPSQLVTGTVAAGLNRVNDGNTATLYSAELTEGGYLEYRITENTAVEKITIFQGEISNAAVSMTDADGATASLGTADSLFKVFDVPSGKKVHSIRLEFAAGAKVAISEIGLKCAADTSGDVGVAVENIYLDEAPADSSARVNLALNQPVEAPTHDGNRPENAVDGSEDSRWSGNNGGSGYFKVDLGLYTNIIEEIKVVYHNKVYPTAYSIKVSDNGEKWVEVGSGTHTAGQEPVTDTLTLAVPVVARYVKLEFTAFNTAAAVQNSVGIKELTVNGYRRTASMEYKSAEAPEEIHTAVNGAVTLPDLVSAVIEDMSQSSYTVRVLPTWNPATVDTASEGVKEAAAVLPVTLNLDNASNVSCVQRILVGQQPAGQDVERDINLARNQTVTVSAVENGNTNWTGDKAVDGDTSSRWSSGALNSKASGTVADQWIIVDLGSAPVRIKSIAAAYYNKVWPMQYRMELSNDQTNWTEVKSYEREAANSGNIVDTVNFQTPISARYLRLYFPKEQLNTSAAGGAVSITELTVTGDRLNRAVEYESLRDSFSAIDADSSMTAEDLDLPVLLNATWKMEGSESTEAVQLLASWDLSGYAQAEGEITITSPLFTDSMHKNSKNLTAAIVVNKAGSGDPVEDLTSYKEELAGLIAQAEEAAADESYTEESRQAATEAANTAKALLESETVDAQQLQDMIEALEAVLEAMEKAELPKENKPWIFTDMDSDVKNNTWKYKAVTYVYNVGDPYLMGPVTGTTEFQPDRPLERGMLATVLYRWAEIKEVTAANPFTDVQAGKYYHDPIVWAADLKIVSGDTGRPTFRPTDHVKRSEIAKMLYEYGAKYLKLTMEESGDLNQFTDVKEVPGWAVGYVKWATGNGIITGKPNGDGTSRLAPSDNATRAECAVMIQRFADKYIK